MKSLFWKIFLWFWGAMIIIGLTLYGVVLTTRPDPLPQPWRETAAASMSAYSSAAVMAWRSGGQAGLSQYLQEIENRSRGHFWLYASDGRELSGHPIPPVRMGDDQGFSPPPPADALRQPGRARPPRPVETPELLQRIRRRAAGQQDTAFRLERPRVLLAQNVQSSGEDFQLVGSLPEPRFGRLVASPFQQVWGGLAALGLSTLVCYGLVRYLTAPLISLREATRKLAAGDLSARTGAAQNKRRDEVADLGRDFDTMASRIEVLLTSQRRLLGDVSHELRSPLTRLSMALALARRHATGGNAAEMEAAFERIAREKERLNELIGQLLELVRLESGEYSDACEILELDKLIQEIADDVDFEARQHEREVLFSRSTSCQVRGSHELLHRAVENVVRNAVTYTPPRTAVSITLDIEGGYSVLRVRDSGEGVPVASLEKLFEPFYRVAEARDRDSGGVGLGLAITARAVASHGGSIAATNIPGGGLQIEIRLPLARSTAAMDGA